MKVAWKDKGKADLTVWMTVESWAGLKVDLKVLLMVAGLAA